MVIVDIINIIIKKERKTENSTQVQAHDRRPSAVIWMHNCNFFQIDAFQINSQEFDTLLNARTRTYTRTQSTYRNYLWLKILFCMPFCAPAPVKTLFFFLSFQTTLSFNKPLASR